MLGIVFIESRHRRGDLRSCRRRVLASSRRRDSVRRTSCCQHLGRRSVHVRLRVVSVEDDDVDAAFRLRLRELLGSTPFGSEAVEHDGEAAEKERAPRCVRFRQVGVDRLPFVEVRRG